MKFKGQCVYLMYSRRNQLNDVATCVGLCSPNVVAFTSILVYAHRNIKEASLSNCGHTYTMYVAAGVLYTGQCEYSLC